jgi:hypothetical protein
MPDDKLTSEYSDIRTKYRNLLTSKIFEKSEQIKNEFKSFAKIHGLSVSSIPDSLEAYSGDKIKIKLTFMTPQPDRAQGLLTIFFTSPKEFYLNIAHTTEPLKEIYPDEKVTSAALKDIKNSYEDLLISDVYITSIDKDQLSSSGKEIRYSHFIDIIEELYSEPRKF